MDSNFTNETNKNDPAVKEQKQFSITSLVLGLCGLLAWCFPCIGYFITVTGIIMGVFGLTRGGKGMAIAGIILSVISLLFTFINSIAGALMAMNMF